MTKCWEEQPQKRPTFQWLCSEVKRLLDDQKVCLQDDLCHLLKVLPNLCLFPLFYLFIYLFTHKFLSLF